MNIEKFTSAARAVISNAQMLAAKNNHQQLLPIHFLVVLAAEEQDVIRNLLTSLGASANLILTRSQEELARIPSVEISGGGGQVSISSDSLKLLEKSLALATTNKDSFVTIERFFEALTYDKEYRW